MAHEIKTEEEFNKLINARKMSIVDFSADWCPACGQIAPIFNSFAETYTDIQFLKVNVDNFEEMSTSAEVSAMPTYIVYESGKMTSMRLIGADADALNKLIKSISNITPSNELNNGDPIKVKHYLENENTGKNKMSSRRKHCLIS